MQCLSKPQGASSEPSDLLIYRLQNQAMATPADAMPVPIQSPAGRGWETREPARVHFRMQCSNTE